MILKRFGLLSTYLRRHCVSVISPGATKVGFCLNRIRPIPRVCVQRPSIDVFLPSGKSHFLLCMISDYRRICTPVNLKLVQSCLKPLLFHSNGRLAYAPAARHPQALGKGNGRGQAEGCEQGEPRLLGQARSRGALSRDETAGRGSEEESEKETRKLTLTSRSTECCWSRQLGLLFRNGPRSSAATERRTDGSWPFLVCHASSTLRCGTGGSNPPLSATQSIVLPYNLE
jgi:hypothetical protein